MGPREFAEIEDLLDRLSDLLKSTKTLKYGASDTVEFRKGLAELKTRSSEIQSRFASDAFPLVAQTLLVFFTKVVSLIQIFPGKVSKQKEILEELKTIWHLEVRPELNRVERAFSVSTEIILPEDSSLLSGKDKSIREITFEINRCFRSGAYNACSVMMRRLLETLIIKIHDKKGLSSNVQDVSTGYFLKLEQLIDVTVKNNVFGLSGNALKAFPKLKRLGDWGAHNYHILLRESDINNLKADARLCFEELLNLI